MLQATARTYRKSCGYGYYEYDEYWKCPHCGRKQIWSNVDGNIGSTVDECCKCGNAVEVTFRRIHKKNF